MLIGLPNLAKERRVSKIVIDRRVPNIKYSLFVIVKGRHFTIFLQIDKFEIDF